MRIRRCNDSMAVLWRWGIRSLRCTLLRADNWIVGILYVEVEPSCYGDFVYVVFRGKTVLVYIHRETSCGRVFSRLGFIPCNEGGVLVSRGTNDPGF